LIRLLKDIIREVEAFDYKCEAYIKNLRLFEDIFNKTEAFSKNLSSEAFLNYFQRNEGFFHYYRTF
jgi:hypothetical protein